jgi:hypothetical protein
MQDDSKAVFYFACLVGLEKKTLLKSIAGQGGYKIEK